MRRWTNPAIEPMDDGKPCVRARADNTAVAIWQLVLLGSLLLVSWTDARGQEPVSGSEPASPPRALATTISSAVGSTGDTGEADPAAVRAETLQRLKEHELTAPSSATIPAGSVGTASASASGSMTSGSAGRAATVSASSSDPSVKKPLPALLQDRLHWLNEYDATSLALQKATYPDPTPEQQASEAKSDLVKVRSILNQAAEAPEKLLPALFRNRSVKVSSTLAAEMKDAIEAASNELKDWKNKLETLRAEIARWNSAMNARRADRDSLFERVTSLSAKNEEFKSAVTDAQTAAERRQAHERLINFQWQLRVETLRLRVIEAQLALEAKLSEVRDQRVEVYRAHVQVVAKTLEPMQARYRVVAEDQERVLARAKADEDNTARSSDDPLERFRARRTADLLALETNVIRNERDLVISPAPSYEEQKTLADHADFDFANIKELLDDGKVSRLDAIRLNNEFRRIGPERDRLLKDVMAPVEAHLQFYEDALTNVELELLQDSLHDRFEHDLLRERLPPSRWAEGEALIGQLELKHRTLLMRRRRALDKLCERASHTLVQVTRRLNILDQEYGFIRTNIFWVRDQEPIGLPTLTQGAREFNSLVKGSLRLVNETVKPNLWGQPSGEFLVTALAVVIIPIVAARLRRALGALIKLDLPAPHTFTRGLRALALALARAAIWPLYLILLAYAARVAPWPRSLGILVSAVATGAAIAILVHDLLHWVTSPSGWPEHYLGVPGAVARQLNTGSRFVVMAAAVLLLPVYLFDHELIAPEGKPITAPAIGRLLILGYELVVWGTCMRLLRGYSPLWGWLSLPVPATTDSEPPELTPSGPAEPVETEAVGSSPFSVSSWAYAVLVWLSRRRRLVTGLILASIAAVIALDVRGYSFTARRLALGGSQTTAAIVVGMVLYRAIAHAISRNAWRWARPDRSWAMALTSAMALRAKVRLRGAAVAPTAEVPTAPPDVANDGDVSPDDLAIGVARLAAYAVTALTLLAIAWIWEVDMALLQLLLNQPLWTADVTVGDLTLASTVILLGALSWRYMNTLFAVTIFPRMPDDPGVRFAVVTLCRYAMLGLTSLVALGAIHVDLAKIGVVLAALGVGLGFGLQEVVSNFVCGIILLLERPIRIGDVVTVAGTTGKVDRINIRATTIINSDNQSMIVPNREFITGNLVNWTLKDKILRVPIKMTVAYGTDPDRVVDLLLRIARADADVMINPAPSAALEGFGDSSLLFGLYTFVPEPGLSGTVKHRLCAEIQRRFTQEGIVIPYPTHELHLNNRLPHQLARALESTDIEPVAVHPYRYDPASKTAPAPHAPSAGAQASALLDDELASRRSNNK
jgi:small-conductance mechanosensitive channel